MKVRETRVPPPKPGAGGIGPLQERIRELAEDEKPAKDAEIVDDKTPVHDWKDMD